MLSRALLAITSCFTLAHHAHANIQPAAVTDSEPAAKVRIIASHDTIQPGTDTWIGIEFDIADKWHIYWPGQNDSGYAPSVEWTLPDGVTVGPLHWPTPKRYVMPGDILDHTYEGKLILLSRLSVAPDAPTNAPLTIKADLSWLECEEGCVPREATLSHTIKLSDSEADPASPATSKDNSAIQEQLKQLPIDDADLIATALRVSWTDSEHITILATNPLVSRIAFYPHEDGIQVKSILANAESKGPNLKLRVTPSHDTHLKGIVQVWNDDGRSLGAYLLDESPRSGTSDKIK